MVNRIWDLLVIHATLLLIVGCPMAMDADTQQEPPQEQVMPDEPIDLTMVDMDSDGLSAAIEQTLGTSDSLADTDLDGLSDFDEVNDFGTDPLLADTDGDGLSDFDEVHLFGTDPTDADTDSDGLSDLDELIIFDTDPLLADTDDDGLSDGAELDAGSSPLLADTDGDGLSDLLEVALGTSPILGDTDGDGFSDSDELASGTNPLDPTDPTPFIPGDLFSFLTQNETDVLLAMTDTITSQQQILNSECSLEAAREFAGCSARCFTGPPGGTQIQCRDGCRTVANREGCDCDQETSSFAIKSFENAFLQLINTIGFTVLHLSAEQREEVSTFMHDQFDQDQNTFSGCREVDCSTISFLCS